MKEFLALACHVDLILIIMFTEIHINLEVVGVNAVSERTIKEFICVTIVMENEIGDLLHYYFINCIDLKYIKNNFKKLIKNLTLLEKK
jgi:hypothetical protein